MFQRNTKHYFKSIKIQALFFLGLLWMNGQASSSISAIKILYESDSALARIRYKEGEFFSSTDDLTGISHTPCCPPKTSPDPQKILHGYVSEADCRVSVNDTGWPYSMHGHMTMTFDRTSFTGSGVMVGPHHVLTAAHNLYNRNSKSWAKDVLFACGRQEEMHFGANKGCILLVSSKWCDPSLSPTKADDYDLGMVILDTCIGDFTGWAGLFCAPNILLENHDVSVTGYPADKGKGTKTSTQMWTMKGAIKEMGDNLLHYPITTFVGNSGGGIWGEWSDYPGFYTAGIHVQKDGEHNKGVRISRDKFDQIVSWIKQYQLEKCFISSPERPLLRDPLEYISELFTCVGQHHQSQIERALTGKDAQALHQVGQLYYDSKEISQNYEKAFACFLKAAQMGYKDRLSLLGECYELGRGTKRTYLTLLACMIAP
jgi:V8-like Glu-specific endopeptidase